MPPKKKKTNVRNEQIDVKYKQAFKRYKQETGLPGEVGYLTPLPKKPEPEIPSYWGISDVTTPEKLSKIEKGIIGLFGTWEAKKRAMPELQRWKILVAKY